jgi:hypothetical protein
MFPKMPLAIPFRFFHSPRGKCLGAILVILVIANIALFPTFFAFEHVRQKFPGSQKNTTHSSSVI